MPRRESQQDSLFTSPITGGATAYKFLEESQENLCLPKNGILPKAKTNRSHLLISQASNVLPPT